MDIAATTQKPRGWYNSYHFPLVPQLSFRKADMHNTSGFQFNWLFIRLWSLDTFQFEIGIVLSEHWGIGFIGILPYLRWCICLPFPPNLAHRFSNLTSRKPNLKQQNTGIE